MAKIEWFEVLTTCTTAFEAYGHFHLLSTAVTLPVSRAKHPDDADKRWRPAPSSYSRANGSAALFQKLYSLARSRTRKT